MNMDLQRWKWPLTAALALAMIIATWRLTSAPQPAAGTPLAATPTGLSLLALSQSSASGAGAPGATPAGTPTPTSVPPTPTPGPIAVYVSGAVAKPGVYRLTAGARADDAVRAAGGLAADADPARVNLAARLRDEQQIYIPRIGEVNPPLPADGGQTGPEADTSAGDGKININQASLAELDTLPRIGPATAQRIIDYRAANGPFAAIEDLRKVKGIGAATFEELKDLITVGP